MPAVYWWRQHRTPEFVVRCAEQTVEDFARTDGLYAYVLVDEPRAWELTYLDAIRRELARLDPSRETLMVTMRGDTPPAIDRTGYPDPGSAVQYQTPPSRTQTVRDSVRDSRELAFRL